MTKGLNNSRGDKVQMLTQGKQQIKLADLSYKIAIIFSCKVGQQQLANDNKTVV